MKRREQKRARLVRCWGFPFGKAALIPRFGVFHDTRAIILAPCRGPGDVSTARPTARPVGLLQTLVGVVIHRVMRGSYTIHERLSINQPS